ncbi:uracil-DNA glycosylase family protein [Rhizobium mayense]|uniref:Uracil-DNA glycosylase family protein n=1 Tax=Rhizobium mayense TaxID=1312184 RepID=A0ABT7JP01_9HYPH|nr:uracil-DNA glycosylase family protein [Rhizobium mayense]MDL2398079.1 uracil-DNA glycosylase family protein [Rhizobium mayense]
MLDRHRLSDTGASLERDHADATTLGAPRLSAELELLKPKLVVALGATAVSSLLGSKVRVMRDRGSILHPPGQLDVLVTIHPSALLRIREPDEKDRSRLAFIQDLKKIRRFLWH